MKKSYFMLAATAALFAACAETDLVNEVNVVTEPQAIEFETFANKATRATENSSASYSQDLGAHHQTFEVYAYKNVSDTKVFDNETVTYTAAVKDNAGNVLTNAKWSYEGLVYWDKTASEYNFYAAAPAADYWVFNGIDKSTEAAPITKSSAYFTIASHPIVDHNASVAGKHAYVHAFNDVSTDLMIASKEQVTSSSTQKLFEDVQLDFIHILSRLNITVSKASSIASKVVTLKSLKVYNMNGTASFNEKNAADNALSDGTNARWTAATRTSINYTSLADEVLEVATAEKPAEYMLQSLVIPQNIEYESVPLDGTGKANFSKPYFCITYTIEDKKADGTVLSSEEFVVYYNLAAVFGATKSGDIVAFNEGWQNTLNITIEPSVITFTGNAAVWADGTPANTGSVTIE